MSPPHRLRTSTSALLILAVAVLGQGCSSSPADAGGGDDGGADVIVHKGVEAGPGDDSGGGSGSSGGSGTGSGSEAGTGDGGPLMYDGTSGKPCMANSDCQPPNGPGLNVCSTSVTAAPVYPTPICRNLMTCDPGTDGKIHYCDGPDDPSSPGVCYAVDNPPQSGRGVCYPQCLIPTDGSAIAETACQGKNTCGFYGTRVDPASGKTIAIGVCYGGCTTDADCPANSKCQTNASSCRQTVSAPTKNLGDPCTSADEQSRACVCLSGPSGSGFCTVACITGSTSYGCPAGYVCDATVSPSVAGAQNDPGLAGNCYATCTGDGGTCPGTTVCTRGPAGFDCVPQ